MLTLFLLACGPTPTVTPLSADVVTAEKSTCEGLLACRSACESGEALACNQLGLLVHDGRSGAQRNPPEAAAHYRQACELGAGVGCYNLSHMLRNGDGVPVDVAAADQMLERTIRLYEKSCVAGGLTWCTNLAGMVQRGDGRQPDQGHARILYTDTCEKGDPIACLELAYMVREGLGGPADPKAARDILQKSCSGGSGPACNNLALMIEGEGGDPLPFFSSACKLDVPMGCRNLALRSPESERLPLLMKACDAPTELDAMACAVAARMLVEQEPPDTRKAGQYLVRACSVGLAEACVPAVQLAAEGSFLLQPGEAANLVDRGCKLGDSVACEILAAPPVAPDLPGP